MSHQPNGWARLLRGAALCGFAVLGQGCMASKADLAMLQNDLRVMRVESAIADSLHRAELARIGATVRAMDDSIRTLTRGQTKFQGDVLGNLYSMNQQLLQIQELTGQSQRRLQDLRAEMEQRSQTPPTTTPPAETATDSMGGAAQAPGPNQLYQLALGQLRRGAAGAARSGFQELLRQYPTSDIAGDAQFQIAESFQGEGKPASADSVYVVVYTKYPNATNAATALYKHALALQAQGKVTQAREAFDLVVKKYPRSDAAELARDRLRSLR
jgi:tol-pal system protein YbgF